MGFPSLMHLVWLLHSRSVGLAAFAIRKSFSQLPKFLKSQEKEVCFRKKHAESVTTKNTRGYRGAGRKKGGTDEHGQAQTGHDAESGIADEEFEQIRCGTLATSRQREIWAAQQRRPTSETAAIRGRGTA